MITALLDIQRLHLVPQVQWLQFSGGIALLSDSIEFQIAQTKKKESKTVN